MRNLTLIFVLLSCALSACKTPIVAIPPAQCAGLIPSGWRDGVAATPVPDASDAKAWAGAYVGMSGQLEKANGRTSDTIDIFTSCERLVNEARPGGK